MNENKPRVRRRKWKRFKVVGGAIVLIKKTRFIEVGKPRLVELGPIIDISMGGIAVQYVEKKQRTIESDELAIALLPKEIKVEPIPFKIVSDIAVAQLPDGKTIRNRCMEFGKLTDYQSFQLESFIQQYTTAIDRDRRSGLDRRQYNDPRFEDEEYRELYERRIHGDRRKNSK